MKAFMRFLATGGLSLILRRDRMAEGYDELGPEMLAIAESTLTAQTDVFFRETT